MYKDDKYKLRVFEHEIRRIGRKTDGLEPDLLSSLQRFYGSEGAPYYSLVHNGVRFNQFVGVLQLGKYTIEVIPKADKINIGNFQDKNSEKTAWQKLLIDMLKAVGLFDIHAPSSSALNIKTNSILDIYFALFANEVEQLLHKGLIKRYHIADGNNTALKGNILFSKHIQKNFVHKERFYTRYSTYDRDHPLNAILYKTILLLKNINTNPVLNSRIESLLVNFPKLRDIKANETLFKNLTFSRKTEPYRNAINIARLLLLNYHPDVLNGQNHVLALMFDMNKLWEQFVCLSLKKYVNNNASLVGTAISTQSKFEFWQPEKGYIMRLRPDIVVKLNTNKYLVLDTKWKNLNGYKPSPDDLRQMYAYSRFHNCAETVLLYPGQANSSQNFFLDNALNSSGISCRIFEIPVDKTIKIWQENIGLTVLGAYKRQ